MKLWQLKNPQTGENIGGLQPLPENWGPIFGMEGVKDRLGDLSWLGIMDRCWVEVDAPDEITDQKSAVDAQISNLLEEATLITTSNKSSLTKSQFQLWIEYKRKLELLHLDPGYPNNLPWPAKPE